MNFVPSQDQLNDITGKPVVPQQQKELPVSQQAVLPPNTPPNSVQDQFMPEITMEMKNLPSQGKSYPVNSLIKYRPYRYGEVKKINQSRQTPKDQFLTILEGITTDFDPLELTLYDAMYLAILRKISTINDSKLLIKYFCKTCSQWGDFTTPTNEISFHDLEAPDLPVRVEFSFGELHFGPLTLRKYFDILNAEKELDEDKNLIYKNQDILFSAGTVQNESLKSAYNIIYNLESEEDIKLLEEVDKYLEHGIEELDYVCKLKTPSGECNTKIKVKLDGGQALILPFRKRKVDVKSRIHFGNKRGN